MRVLKRNDTFTIFGIKIGNTYIKSENGKYYSIANKAFTKFHKDCTKAFWILQKYYFQHKVLGVIRPC